MKFILSEELKVISQDPVVGNVYPVKGGSGAKHGHMQVLVSITSCVVTYLTITKSGTIVGGGNYGSHYLEEKCPIAFCKGLEELNFNITRLGQ